MDRKSDTMLSSEAEFENVEMRFLNRKYELILSYNDPFLRGSTLKKIPTRSRRNSTSSNTKTENRNNEPALEVKYYGSIIGSSKIAIIEIDNRSVIMKENEERFKCKVLKIYEESILMIIRGKKTKIVKES